MDAHTCPPCKAHIGYVLLWFPLASETFVFREVVQLRERGLPISAYTLYGEHTAGQSAEMKAYDGPLTHISYRSSLKIIAAFWRALRKRPGLVWRLLREGLFRRMRSLETVAENSLCFFAGFLLAEYAQKDGITLLHAPWANGPATACWIASRLSGIPFAFTGRAGDMYPQDGVLPEKARDATFIRTNNAANIAWLSQFCPANETDKIHLVYNSLTLKEHVECLCPYTNPYKILAIGRFVRTKGFTYLITAVARLLREGVSVRLTLVGDGFQHRHLVDQIHLLGIEHYVDLPGFVPNDQVISFMKEHDVLIMPSVIPPNGDRDGIPNVIMEALSNRMPVIATDVCGIGEVIETGKTGLLLPQYDPAAIADAVRWLIDHRDKAIAMAEAGRARVRSMFDAQKNISTLYDLYLQAGTPKGEQA